MLLIIQKYFVKCQQAPSNFSSNLPIKIIKNHQTSMLTVHISVDQKNILFNYNQSFYVLNKECKMLPEFQAQGLKVKVKKITIYDQEKKESIILQCDQFQSNMAVYQKLKRTISHKGFNDFYKPLKRLGRGTFATVYLIQHKFSKIKKAAKVFSYQGQKIQFKGRQALESEIKTLRQIDHPNLIKYDGIYETDNLIYLVTEYLSGGTLQDMMKNKCVHTGQFVSKIIKDILSGLRYLDQHHIMHRDIKPQNIIYRKQQDQWVLSDFGLAAKSNQDYIYDKCGTMGYIAPEIMEMNQENPRRYSQECDIYSLGIIAYTLIIGSLPFHVESQNFFQKKIIWDLFDKPECTQLNTQIIHFLQKLLTKNPKQRYTAKQALQSPFFTNKSVVDGLYAYHQRRRQQRYDKILKIANIQY